MNRKREKSENISYFPQLLTQKLNPLRKEKNEFSVQWGLRVVVHPLWRARMLEEVHLAEPGI